MRCSDCLKKYGPSKDGLTHIFTCAICGIKLNFSKEIKFEEDNKKEDGSYA